MSDTTTSTESTILGNAILTTDHAASSYGIPVLVLDGVAYGPADKLRLRDDLDTLDREPTCSPLRQPRRSDMTALDYVQAYYRVGDYLPTEVRAFLAQAIIARSADVHTLQLMAGRHLTDTEIEARQ
jgi:hypothetical protein